MSDDNNTSQQSLINSYWAMKKKHLEESGAPDLSGESDQNLAERQQAHSQDSGAGGMFGGTHQQAKPSGPQQVQPLGQPAAPAAPAAAPAPAAMPPLARNMDSPFGQAPAPEMSHDPGDSLGSSNARKDESDEEAALRIAKELSLLADSPSKPINAPDPSPLQDAEASAEAVAQKLVQQAALAASGGESKEDREAQFANLLNDAKGNSGGNPGGKPRRKSRYTQPVAADTPEGKARMQALTQVDAPVAGKFARGATPKTDHMQDRLERRIARRDQETAELIERRQHYVASKEEPQVIGRSGLGRDIKSKQAPRRMSGTAAHLAGNMPKMDAPMAADAMAGSAKAARGSSLRMRILPVTIIGAACLFGAKVGGIMLDSGILVPQITENAAFAQEAPAEGEAASDEVNNQIEPVGVEGEGGSLIDPVTGEVLAPAPAAADDQQQLLGANGVNGTNLFAPGAEINPEDLNGSELEVLQGLRARRERLAAHEADLRLRERELEAIEQRIDEKIAEMRRIQGTIDSLLEKYDQEKDGQVESLVKIYEAMKPKKAARVFELMEMEKLLDIAERMKEKKLSPVLAVMSPQAARALTEELYNRRRLPDLNRAGRP